MSLCPTSLNQTAVSLTWTVRRTCGEACVSWWALEEKQRRVSWLTCGSDENSPLRPFLLCTDAPTVRADVGSNRSDQSRGFFDTQPGDAAADEALRRVFVRALLVVSVPVAVYSLQMTTFIHQSQLRSTLGIPGSTSFQCCLSLHLPCYSSSQRNWVSVVNIPLGSQWRSACALRSSRVASSPTWACCVVSA